MGLLGDWQQRFGPARRDSRDIEEIHALRANFEQLTDEELREQGRRELLPVVAATAVMAERVLGQRMYDVQLRGALVLARGSIAEMQTGEGKTLTAVPAVVWMARKEASVHVMTVNDYLARRDAAWMGEIYRRLGLSVGCIQQDMTAGERCAAYACDITYATANEIGFDFLRDRLALRTEDLTQRPFGAVLVDEADSILIDEARIPLIVAGATGNESGFAPRANQVALRLHGGTHFGVDRGAHNVFLTEAGIRAAEKLLGCGALYSERNMRLYTALIDAIHAHVLLRRDVDYVVRNGVIEMVDEFRGRVALDRRWPAGLHTAVEVKEGVATKEQGMILGSITMQNLIGLYPRVCGMTGTAASSAGEFKSIYQLQVETIPTNKPVIRMDEPDRVYADKAAKVTALVEEIRKAHLRGQPVLVGTASVAESEEVSRGLVDIPHQVLNAKNDEAEAEIVARAGERGAVTISTNMAGRGIDIRLGAGVAELGGLYVLGTNKNESRRIDNQLRGRAGRQGDPGRSQFFVSLEDDLVRKYRDLNPRYRDDPDAIQRLVEGQTLDIRLFLNKYEAPIEGQRHHFQTYRQKVLSGEIACESELERTVTLRTIDDMWADYLAHVAEYKEGLQWISWGGRDPLPQYMAKIHGLFAELEANLPGEIQKRIGEANSGAANPNERGAVWTYVTTDQPFGTISERIARGLMGKVRGRR